MIQAQGSFNASTEKMATAAAKPEDMRLGAGVKCVREGVAKTLIYTRFPMEH